MTQEYEIFKGRCSTTFEGDILSTTSSRRSASQDRWTEYEIYRTVGGKYVIVIYGKSKIPSEKQKTNIIEATTPSGVLDALKFKNREGNIYLTHTAEDALAAAADNDKGLYDIFHKNHID